MFLYAKKLSARRAVFIATAAAKENKSNNYPPAAVVIAAASAKQVESSHIGHLLSKLKSIDSLHTMQGISKGAELIFESTLILYNGK